MKNDRKRFTKEEFVKRAVGKHGDKFNYDKVIYTNCDTKVVITCKEHGDFEQTPYNHCKSKTGGCKTCSVASMSKTKSLGLESFIKQCSDVHGDKYDYSYITKYKNNQDMVRIVCPIHGDFVQKAKDHLRGSGCYHCGVRARNKCRTLTPEDFVKISTEVHSGLYSYDNSLYTKSGDKITITCPIHGDFLQNASSHMKGHGCPRCNCGILERGFYKSEKASNIYILKMSNKDEEFIKVGLSTKVNKRITTISWQVVDYKIDTLFTKEDKANKLFKCEQMVLSLFKEYKYKPHQKFAGHTECFHVDSASEIIEFILQEIEDEQSVLVRG